jgi:hypothetical protein
MIERLKKRKLFQELITDTLLAPNQLSLLEITPFCILPNLLHWA